MTILNKLRGLALKATPGKWTYTPESTHYVNSLNWKEKISLNSLDKIKAKLAEIEG